MKGLPLRVPLGPFFFGVFWFCKRVRVLMAFPSSPLISLSHRFARAAGSFFFGVVWFRKRVGVLTAFSSSPLISLSHRFGRADMLLFVL